jgi:outer membrane cobalamin receptor
VRGVDMSLVVSTDEHNKKFGVTALIGYTYVEPITLTPDSVYATDSAFGGAGRDLTYKNSSMDTTGNVLKYRFKHMVKGDIEFRIYQFSVGCSYRYYSQMQNIDQAFVDIETLTAALDFVDDIKATHYWKTHYGYHVWDARVSWQVTKLHKVSLICNNLLNVDYSLRPMKIESPRTIALQYVLTF